MKHLVLPLVALACVFSPAAAATIEVPADYSTIQAAIDAATGGDVIIVANGTYAESLVLNKTITLASDFFNTADQADITNTIIDGGTEPFAIQIGSSVGVGTLIQGFTITGDGAGTDGVSATGRFDFWDNIVTVTGGGFGDGIDYEDGGGGTVRRCVIEDNGDDGIDLDYRNDVTIEDNVIQNNGDDGIEYRFQDDPFPASPLFVVIRNNVISGNGEDGIQLIDDELLTDRHTLIEGNLILNNDMAGIGSMPNQNTIEDYGGADQDEPVWIINNTIVGNNHGVTGGDNMVLLNNIIVGSTNIGLKRALGNSIAAYNLFFDNGTDYSNSIVDVANTFFEDPLLNADQTLQAGSPAIDVGIAYFEWNSQVVLDIPPGDFNGTAPDLGALESEAPTVAMVSSFAAYPDRAGVIVEWETSSEVATIGFHVYRTDGRRGEPILVSEQLLPAAVDSPQGATYRLLDRGASTRQAHEYTLVEVEAGGGERSYGPFRVEVDWRRDRPEMRGSFQVEPRAAPLRAASRRERARSEAAARASAASAGSSGAVERRPEPRPERRRTETWLELATREAGLYRVGADEMAAAFGVPLAAIRSRIAEHALLLENRGRVIAWQAERDSSAIYFYAEAIDSLYTSDNAYWLRLRRGPSRDPGGLGLPRSPAPVETAFEEHSHFEQDLIPAMVTARDPESDYWFWEGIAAGDPTQGRKSFSVSSPGLEPDSGWAELGIAVLGLTDTPASPDHHLVVRLNGAEIGSTSWDGAVAHEASFAFSASLLQEAENTVEVEGLLDGEAATSLFFIDSLDLTYRRLYRAENDRLAFSPDGTGTASIDGFDGPDVRVYDVTDPTNAFPLKLSPTGEHAVTLRVVADHAYLAAGESAVGVPTIRPVEVDPRLDLSDRSNAADYLVVAPGWLTAAAEALADHRGRDGLEAKVVALEEVYRQFNHGLPSPHALKRFLSRAHREWRQPPRYLVLLGAGTFDYKDHLGQGGNLVPPLMVGTPWGLFASDVELGDVVEGGGPEIAVGRIPVIGPGELEDYMDKLVTYESGAVQGRALLLADDPDSGGDYVADSEAIAELLGQGEVEKIYLSRESIEGAREHLFTSLRRGVALVNYVGHGGTTQLAHEGLLTVSDVSNLDNGDSQPVVAALTCVVGRFEIPGWDSLAESLVLEPASGAVAVWAPSGLSLDRDAAILNAAFVEALGDGETDHISLGDAVLEALRRHAVEGRYPFMWRTYNLVGDPALPLR
jgi:parallel beta-helix repeat protein